MMPVEEQPPLVSNTLSCDGETPVTNITFNQNNREITNRDCMNLNTHDNFTSAGLET